MDHCCVAPAWLLCPVDHSVKGIDDDGHDTASRCRSSPTTTTTTTQLGPAESSPTSLAKKGQREERGIIHEALVRDQRFPTTVTACKVQ